MLIEICTHSCFAFQVHFRHFGVWANCSLDHLFYKIVLLFEFRSLYKCEVFWKFKQYSNIWALTVYRPCSKDLVWILSVSYQWDKYCYYYFKEEIVRTPSHWPSVITQKAHNNCHLARYLRMYMHMCTHTCTNTYIWLYMNRGTNTGV